MVPAVLAQNVFTALVRDEETRAPLVGVNALVDSLRLGGATDANGMVSISNVPAGKPGSVSASSVDFDIDFTKA